MAGKFCLRIVTPLSDGYPEFLVPQTPVNLPLNRCPVPRDEAELRIVIFKVGALGDVLMATPLLHALRRAYPNAFISWFVEPPTMQIVDAHPMLDEVIVWNGAHWNRLMRRPHRRILLQRRLQNLRRDMRRRHFNVFISLEADKWDFLIESIGAETKIGVAGFPKIDGKPHPYRNLYNFVFTDDDPTRPVHRVEEYLQPLQSLNVPEVRKQLVMGFTAGDATVIDKFLAEENIHDAPFVVVAPMTTWQSKCWPAEKYAALGDRLMLQQNLPIVLIGSGREVAEIENVAALMQIRPIIAAGRFSVREIAALIARANVVVSGDTAPMHMAAAIGTPFVTPFGPTPPKHLAPLVGEGQVLYKNIECSPCDNAICPKSGEGFMLCMKRIEVNEVYDATLPYICDREAENKTDKRRRLPMMSEAVK